MSVYSPSVLSQILAPLGAISGLIVGGYLTWVFRFNGFGATVATVSAMVAFMSLSWHAHGYRLSFDQASERLSICPSCFGLALGESTFSFDSIRSLTLRYDGDAFPIVRLEMQNDKSYWFFTRKTVNDFRRLRCLLDLRYKASEPHELACR